MQRWILPLLLASLCSAGGCADLGFLPVAATTTLDKPTHVEAYRTGKLDDHPGYGGKLDGFAVFNTGAIPPDVAQTLAATIADPTSYHDAVRRDEFVPSVGYRFYRRVGGPGQYSVDVLIDFDSDEVLLVQRDPKLRENFRRVLETDHTRQRLLEISRQAFPFDLTVQSMTEYRAPATQPDE